MFRTIEVFSVSFFVLLLSVISEDIMPGYTLVPPGEWHVRPPAMDKADTTHGNCLLVPTT